MFRFWRDTKFTVIIAILMLVVIVYCGFLSQTGIFAIARLKSLDLISKISLPLKPKPQNIDKIAIITIDEESFKALNKKWPWDRAIFAALIDTLSQYKPKLICYDFSFVGESNNKEDDLLLAQAMKNAGNVIIASYFDNNGNYIAPEKLFADSCLGYGFVNKPRDMDYYVRRDRLFSKSSDQETTYSSFDLETICRYFNINLTDILLNPSNNIVKIPKGKDSKDHLSFFLRRDATLPINFQVRFNDFQITPFWKVLNQNLKQDTFENKIVLISLTGEIYHDVYNTPLGVVPGVNIVVNSILMFLDNNFIREMPRWSDFLILVFFVILTAFAVYRLSLIKGFLVSFAAICVFIGISILLSAKGFWADYFGVIFFVSAAYLGINAYKYIQLIIESAHLKTLAITDGLTGLFVLRYLEIRLQNEFERALRYNLNLSLVIIDIDHFKNINDAYGHQQGNLILKSLANILKQVSRKADILVRYGGEEFCIVLPHTAEEGALVFTERLRKTIEAYDFTVTNSKKAMKVTISAGLVNYPKAKAQSTEELIRFADMALYEAKAAGRNRSVIYQPKT